MRWAKIASDLHFNPKVMGAGLEGLVVFSFLLCRHSAIDGDGTIPARHAGHKYMAIACHLSVEQAATGLAACVREELIEIADDGTIVLLGWDFEWRAPQTDLERKRAQRERSKTSRSGKLVTDGHAMSRTVTDRSRDVTPAGVLEESREEKISGAAAPEPPFRPDPPVSASPLPQTRAPAKSKREAKAEHELPGWDALKPGKRAALTKHLEAALRLWELQTELRAGGLKGLRRLSATAERLARVAERLETGMTEAEAVDALQRYADDAKRTGDWTWLNGETNWRAANCDRALGMAGSAPARASPGHGRGLTPQEILDLDMSESPFRLEGGGE